MDIANKLIADHPVMLFTKSWCGYCQRAQKLLTGLGVPYFVFELDKERDGASIQDALEELTEQRSVPNIFIGKEHIGGCDSLTALVNQDRKSFMSRVHASGALGTSDAAETAAETSTSSSGGGGGAVLTAASTEPEPSTTATATPTHDGKI